MDFNEEFWFNMGSVLLTSSPLSGNNLQSQQSASIPAGQETPQFTIFPFYKILSPSEGMRKNKERFFILKYKPVLNDLKLR